MYPLKLTAVLMLGLATAGCATQETTNRNAVYDAPTNKFAQSPIADQAAQQPLVRVKRLTVSVPKSLKVSEANLFYAPGDIVWRGEPYGDRYKQVEALFQNAMIAGVANLDGEVPVHVAIEVQRFHALTEKARYTVGGIHAIQFKMSVTHAQTGALIMAPKNIKADLKGLGGRTAIKAEQQGQTQKVRISAHLANVIHTELTPGRVAPGPVARAHHASF